MRFLLSFLFFVFITCTAMAQKWVPGYFYDTKGNKETGLINPYPRGKGPIRGEGFIEFKEDKKAETIKLSASDIRSYVIERDSFIVAATDRWSDNALDFVRVALDAPLKLYAAFGEGSSGGGGGGFSPTFGGGIGTGIGSGGYGGGFGGGISIPIGGNGSRSKSAAIYFFGTTTADMKPIGNQSFIDVMSEVMGDEPEVVEQIRAKKFGLNNIEKLIAYYHAVEQASKQ